MLVGWSWACWVARMGTRVGAQRDGVAFPAQACVQVAPVAFGRFWTPTVNFLAEFKRLALGFGGDVTFLLGWGGDDRLCGHSRRKVLCVLRGSKVTHFKCSESVLLGSTYF